MNEVKDLNDKGYEDTSTVQCAEYLFSYEERKAMYLSDRKNGQDSNDAHIRLTNAKADAINLVVTACNAISPFVAGVLEKFAQKLKDEIDKK